MQPRELRPADLDYWAAGNPRTTVFTAPGEQEAGFEPCAAIITDDTDLTTYGFVVRTPWTLSEIDLVDLAKGGTLWLSTWGGLPPHMIEVQPPSDRPPL